MSTHTEWHVPCARGTIMAAVAAMMLMALRSTSAAPAGRLAIQGRVGPSTGEPPPVAAFHTSPGLPDPSRVPIYRVFELTLVQRADYGGQANVTDVRIDVEFVPPAGGATVRVGGFYYGTLDDGSSLWKARLAPGALGGWAYHYTFTHVPSGAVFSGTGAFEAVAREPGTVESHPGFLRASSGNPFRFLSDDGRPVFPIGCNDCFGTRDSRQMDGGDRHGALGGTGRHDEEFAAYARAGCASIDRMVRAFGPTPAAPAPSASRPV